MLKLLSIICLLYSAIFYSQKHELSLDYRIGVDINSKNELNNVLSTSYDQGLTLQFKYRIWKKAKLYVMLGHDQSNTKYNIYNDFLGKPERPYPFNTLNVYHHGIHLGFNKKFILNKITIDLGINASTRNIVYKHLSASGTNHTQENTSTFKSFSFETLPYYRNIGLDYNVSIMYKLSKSFSIFSGITHSRSHTMKYQSSAKKTDKNQISTTSQPRVYYTFHNFIYIKTGIIYML